jgi:8-oxo-dGTP pyrophosphatase MutT (NUDIX family)
MEENKNPWKKINSKLIYDNPWIRVQEDQVIKPRGGEGIYGIVHFKNKAIGIIPIDEDGNTWLVGQYRYPLNEYSWEIPMGGGLLELPILQSAQRELREETGLEAKKWTNLLRIHTSNSVTDEEGFIFLAEELTQKETEFEDTEILQIKKLPFKEVFQMAMNNQITDSLSLAGILKLANIRKHLL